MPIHGEYMHLAAHAKIAESVGVPKNRIIIAENGDLIDFSKNSFKILKKVASRGMIIDGKGQEHVTASVLDQRRELARQGAMVVSAAVARRDGHLDVSLALLSHGFLFEDEAHKLLDRGRDIAVDLLEKCFRDGRREPDYIREKVEEGLKHYFHKETGRRPVFLTHIAEL